MRDTLWTEFYEYLMYCAICFVGIVARLGYQLGGSPPPDDPEAFRLWRHKQLWAAVGEFLTVPAFGAAWIGAVHHWVIPIEIVIAGCVISGMMGFGFWLDAFQRIINRKITNV